LLFYYKSTSTDAKGAAARAKKGTDKQLVIFDMADFSTLQCNFQMIRALVSINQVA
jgi:hypothetical protein